MQNINKELKQLFDAGQWQELANATNALLGKNKNVTPIAWLYSGIARIELGNPDIGKKSIEQYLKTVQEADALAFFYLGRACEAKKQILIADSWYAKAIEKDKSTVKYSIYRVVNLFNNNMYEEIKEISNDILKHWNDFELFPLILLTSYEQANTEDEIPQEILQACAGFAVSNKDPQTIKKYIAFLIKYKKNTELENYLSKLDQTDPISQSLICYGKGKIAEESNDIEKAKKFYKKGLKNHFNTLNALALTDVLFLNSEVKEALLLLEKWLKFFPNDVDLLNKIGSTYYFLPNKIDLSIKFFEQALKQEKNRKDIIWNLGLSLLSAGYLKSGWEKYRAREGSMLKRKFEAKEWDGTELKEDEKIMVWSEQGVGDHIMFSTVLPDLIKVVGAKKIIFETDPRLLSFFQRNFPEIEVRKNPRLKKDFSPYITDYNYHIALGTLTYFFRESLEQYNKQCIFKVNPEWEKDFCRRLSTNKLKVGLLWRSSLRNQQRDKYYLPVESLSPLFFEKNDIEWVNLQYGYTEDELEYIAREFGVKLKTWDDIDLKDDLDAVSALIKNLDLVISPSCSVLQLAGALGTETWGFNLHPSWSMHNQEYYPWFEKVRMYQVDFPGPLENAIIEIGKDLKKRVNEKEYTFNRKRILVDNRVHSMIENSNGNHYLTELESEILLAQGADISEIKSRTVSIRLTKKLEKAILAKELELITPSKTGGKIDESIKGKTTKNFESEFRVAKQYSETETLVISFQGNVGLALPFNQVTPYFSPAFSWEKIIEPFNASHLQVRDTWQMWYQVGPLGHNLCNGTETSIDVWLKLIKSKINEFNAKKVICVGTSAGASAAIIFGDLLQVDHVLAISPQAKLLDAQWEQQTGANHITANGKISWREKLIEEYDLKSYDISQHCRSLDKKLSIIYPKLQRSDKAHVDYLSRETKNYVYKTSGKQHGDVDRKVIESLLHKYLG